tara:strand:+ start:447 stop:725 length:279 start_codon:yes stop_codon:yes gene_type:complete
MLSDYLDKVGTLTENQNKAMNFFKKSSQSMGNDMILALLYMYAESKPHHLLGDCGNMKFIVRDGFHKLDPLMMVSFYENLVDFYDGGEEPRE